MSLYKLTPAKWDTETYMAHVTITLESDNGVALEVVQQKNPSAINIKIVDVETRKLVCSHIYDVSDVVEFAHLIIKQYGSSGS